MEKFDLNSSDIDKELKIDDSSVHSLVEELKSHPRKESKYSRACAQANKAVSELTLKLKIVEAELVEEEMKNQKSQSASLRQEIRKSIVGDDRYRKVYLELIEAQETADILNGLMSSWVGRGYLLREIVKLADRTMQDSLRIYKTDPMALSDEGAEKIK
jgi:hypothetical protein